MPLASPDFEVFSQKKKKKKGLKGKMLLFALDFEVFSKKKAFAIQRSDFTREWLITADLFQISLIIFICTVLRPTKEDLIVSKKPCLS